MTNLTRHGVCYNLRESPFFSDWHGYRFVFSSQKHKESFDSKIPVRIPWLNDSLSRRFKMEIDVSSLAVFQLYNQVETRGFRVEVLGIGGKLIWHSADEVVFVGLHPSWKDSSVREETTTDGSEQPGSGTDTTVMLLP